MTDDGKDEKDLLRDMRKTVFLVDRNDSFIMYLRILLERMGFRVSPLKKHKLLKELMPIVKPDLVLLGSVLEGTDPVEIVRDLKSVEACSGVPVILIAQKEDDDLEFECAEAGFAGCLERPINIFKLFKVVYNSIVFSSGEKRENLRTPFREKVEMSYEGKTGHYRATSLSEGGMFIRTSEVIPRGTALTITVPLGFGTPETFRGEVIYNKTTLADGDPAETGIAVRFDSPTQDQVSNLTVCILGLLVGDILEDQEEPVVSLVSRTNNLYEDIVLEHIRLGQELKDYQLRLATILEKLPVGMIICSVKEDGDLEVLSSNPAVESLLGVQALGGDGGTPTLLPDWEETGFLEEFRRVGREGGTFQASNVRYKVGSIDGYFDFLAFQPSPRTVAVMFSDVSRRRRAEEESFRMQKLESLGFLAGGIAHDFNNLLQVITGSVDLAQMMLGESEKSLPPKRIERMQYLLGQAEDGLRRATKLAGKLLTFARGGDPVIRPIDLAPVINDSVEFALHGSTIGSTTEICEDLKIVPGDPEQLHQAFTNIVMNAKQAMPRGGEMSVRVENTVVGEGHGNLEEGAYVVISISDTGVGIPEEMLRNIFDPYFTTKQEGSGLGLSNALSIIHKHGGWIDVESVVGEGTTALTYLPAGEGEPAAEPAEAESVGWTGTGRVLLMDDETSVWPVFQGMLEKLGLVSFCVRSGEEMLKVYSDAWRAGTPFDLVIMDLTVRGGMGGEEAIRKLLEIDPGARAVVSSGYSESPVMAKFRDYGFLAALPKPSTTAALSKVLEEVLG